MPQTPASAAEFCAGYAEADITPEAPMPFWGYSMRHALPARGTADPLMAKALVFEADGERLGIVKLDTGRAPTAASMARLREAARERADIDLLLVAGSHTHNGPVLELLDEPGLGQGRLQAAVDYVARIERIILQVIEEAAAKLASAQIGWDSTEPGLNRNRQWPGEPKPLDDELTVIRIDSAGGVPMVLLAHYAAHPILTPVTDLRWSTDWVGPMERAVAAALGAPCMLLQGAAGDLSPDPPGERSPEAYGLAVARAAIPLARNIAPAPPEQPSLRVAHETLDFGMRIDPHDPFVRGVIKNIFFPEMIAVLEEYKDGQMHPEVSSVLLNGNLALVCMPGEVFSQHGLNLERRSPIEKTLLIGYCNGHNFYFPTRAALEVGGIGTEPALAWAEPGAGEAMVDVAVRQLERLQSGDAPEEAHAEEER